MTVLVIAEHDNQALKGATLNAVTAAQKIGGDIHVAVIGSGVGAVAQAAAGVAGVSKVLSFDDAALAEQTSEAVAAQILSVASQYSHIVAPATSMAKSVLPRVAAKLDVAQISEIVAVESADTFVRPVYAGNVMATVQSVDPIKVITVRTTGFDAAAASGGSAAVEAQAVQAAGNGATFVSREVAQSDRPELTSANVVVSGGRGLGSAENFKIIEALADAIKSGHIAGAAVDVFPKEPKANGEEFVSPLRGLDNVILTPHVGGSTMEAQANIGLEVAEKFVAYSDKGMTLSAVNFPEIALPLSDGQHRLLHIHKNVPGVLSKINTLFAEQGINISGQSLMTKGDIGYLVMDVDASASQEALDTLHNVEGTIRVRVLF